MKGLLRICLICMVLLTANRAIAVNITTTFCFEELLDGEPLASHYPGVKFETSSTGENWGEDWVAADIRTWNYDASSWPTKEQWWDGNYWVHDYVCAWTGVVAAMGKISFDNQDATFVEMGYCAGTTLNLAAYDSFDTLIGSVVSGPANRRVEEGNESGPGTLRVDWDGINPIAYVIIYDSAGWWEVDNISTDASGIIPEPTTISLFGLGGLSLLRKRRA